MHVSIFWRVFLAQAFLIVLILAVCLYALFPLKQLTSLSEDLLELASLSTDLLDTYDASVDELERLRTIFVAQVSSAEQYVSERNADVKQEFLLGNTTVRETFERIDSLIQTPVLFHLEPQLQRDLDTGVVSAGLLQSLAEHGIALSPQASVERENVAQRTRQDMRWLITNVDQTRYSVRTEATQAQTAEGAQVLAVSHIPQEQVLLDHVKDLYIRYATGLDQLTAEQSPPATWQEWRDGITTGIDTLMRMRKHAIADKTKTALRQAAEAARSAQDQVTFAYRGTGGLIAAGLIAAVLLSYLFARRISHPLRKLSRELRHVGRGEFRRSVRIRAPKEVAELSRAFNWMAVRLAELDKMKADFIAHVSHELRTPLTALQEGTALLLEEIPGPLTPSQREILDVVRNHGERLFASISSMLDLSKMEAGMMEYVYSPSELRPLIDRSVETVRLIAQKRHVELAVGPIELLPLLSLDEQHIQKVLDNLLVNAVKFTPADGRVQVSAVVRHRPAGGAQDVEVRVTDTGQGIAADEVERVFDRFYQSARQPGESLRGTGLGLSLARHIVEAHGGRIWVKSQLGQGSTFFFTVPIDQALSVNGHIVRQDVRSDTGLQYTAPEIKTALASGVR